MFKATTMTCVLAAALLLAAAPASAGFKLERRLALEPGGTFTLDTSVGAVIVTGDSSSGALVTVTSSADDVDKRFDFRFDERAGAVTVTVTRRGGWTSGLFDSFNGKVQFTIHVPRKTAVTVTTAGGSVQTSALTGSTRVRSSGGGLTVRDVDGTVDVNTSGGPIEVHSVHGNVSAVTSGGGITIDEVQGSVRADTSGGGIQIAAVRGDVEARTSGGGVHVRDAGGHVNAHSSGGPVTVALAAGNGKGGDLSSSGGGVQAEVDPAVALSIDAASSGGGVTSDLPVTGRGKISSSALSGDLNGGGPVLKLRSSGGGIRISATSKSAAGR